MRTFQKIAAVVLVLLMGSAIVWDFARQKSLHTAPLTQDVYVWQHDWNTSVYQAVVDQHAQFQTLVLLAAEISPRAAPVKVVEIHPDYAQLARSTPRMGLAIRVGNMGGSVPFDPRSEQSKCLCKTAKKAIATAQAGGVFVSELQLDFDAPEAELEEYATWVSMLRSAVTPTPVVITALPSWLKHSEFADLARAAGSFVIQVHSLHRPSGPDSNRVICDPIEAGQAVEKSAKFGVPFRVALPTYSYLTAFSAEGKFLGLSAEGPLGNWPAGSILKPMRSDPAAIAPLVAKWTAHPPSNMTGLIWYRLPVAGDSLNWAPVTLGAVMAGRSPQANLITEIEHPKPGLVDVFVKNSGDADSNIRLEISAQSFQGFAISEGINEFDRLEEPSGNVIFRDSETDGRRIAPGERIQVGWLRPVAHGVAADTEVQAHVTAAIPQKN